MLRIWLVERAAETDAGSAKDANALERACSETAMSGTPTPRDRDSKLWSIPFPLHEAQVTEVTIVKDV
jgi:hypothetical protein